MSIQTDSKRGQIFVPCAFNPKAGADKEMCERLSGTPVQAQRCEEVKCKCKWRIEVIPADESADRHSTSHELHKIALQRQGTPLSRGTNGSVSSMAIRPVPRRVNSKSPSTSKTTVLKRVNVKR